MKITQLIVLALLLLIGSTTVMAASSSLTLQYGPSFSQPILPLARTQPAYDFEVSQFWHQDASTTFLEISVTEHLEQSTVTSGPDFICSCFSHHTAPRKSIFTFVLPSPVAAPFGYQVYNNFYNPVPFSFNATLDTPYSTSFLGGLSTVQIGEVETRVDSGVEILTGFAADFRVQLGVMSFVNVIDPETGLSFITQEFIAYPGNWFAGSLRYQSDAAAFAYLAPVPEASSYGMLLSGLAMVGFMHRRRKLKPA